MKKSNSKGVRMRGEAATSYGVDRPGKEVVRILRRPAVWLVLAACAVGVFLRVWKFGEYPPGLHADEASIAVEAASLHYFGMDRNGESFPVHFIAWGGGQNVLYAYLLAPLVPLGLSPFVIRLPMLLSGLLSLIVVYAIARKLFSPTAAILSIFLLAVSPWHVMISRWALESNLFPFIFSIAFLCLLHAERHHALFPLSMGLLALSLYAYGTAYFLVPVFAVLTVVFLWRTRVLSRTTILTGSAVFCIIGFPIFLFVLVNVFQWSEIRLGWMTIPRVIGDPRIVEMAGFLHGGGLGGYVYGLMTTAKILFLHTDDLIYNSLPPFGFLFPGAIVPALGGAFLAGERLLRERSFGLAAFFSWLALAFLLGIIQPPTMHRINILFLPLILCVAVLVEWILRGKRFLAIPLALGIAAYTILFYREYMGEEYRKEIGWEFSYGLVPAVQSIEEYPEPHVCLTNELAMPYIYVQLADFRDPREWLADMEYENPDVKFRIVQQMGRYSFGIQNCPLDPGNIFILKSDQSLPDPLDESDFTVWTFGDYVVYIPKSIQA
jgi:4-amino-4-deoxy-L-arabinose transferase-like glycosyltransferase